MHKTLIKLRVRGREAGVQVRLGVRMGFMNKLVRA